MLKAKKAKLKEVKRAFVQADDLDDAKMAEAAAKKLSKKSKKPPPEKHRICLPSMLLWKK